MRYRIVNRKRFITFATTVILMFAFIFAGVFNTVTALGNKEVTCIEVTVCDGDTIWGIAKEYGCKTKDIREVVYDICNINGIEGAMIYSGQVIKVPEQ